MENARNVELRYKFNSITQCNMCSSNPDQHKLLGKRLNKSQGRSPRKRIGITTTICKCKNCGLIFSNPQPIPYDLQDHYGVAPDDYWNEEYFQVDENYFQGVVRVVKELIELKPGMKSLDIGAGIGKAMIVLSGIGFDAYGFEASASFYEKAISQMGINPEKLKLGMIEELEYPENYFDFITFGAVLEHLYDPSDSIIRAMNWLKPNGIMHIEVPSSDWLVNKMINLYYWLGRTDYVGNLSPMHAPFHLYEFGLKSFQEHAKTNNYEIAFHDYYVCPTHMPKILDHFIKPYMKWTNTGMQLCVWLRKKDLKLRDEITL
ncbi:MAG: class I SAM-dependent methyltransferase [Bacteroidetes bacterium]|nr:MAG: class I SAM-dependent methyltransferase [Bacteroidota bacterium]